MEMPARTGSESFGTPLEPTVDEQPAGAAPSDPSLMSNEMPVSAPTTGLPSEASRIETPSSQPRQTLPPRRSIEDLTAWLHDPDKSKDPWGRPRKSQQGPAMSLLIYEDPQE